MDLDIEKPIHSKPGEPVWELAFQFPRQGTWTEEDYLGLDLGRHVELIDGNLEFQEMPDQRHQRLLILLLDLLRKALAGSGEVIIAPMPMRVPAGFREPDLLLLLKENYDKRRESHWDGADLVVEIVSKGKKSRDRDFVEKRRDYAAAGVREYWIVDPQRQEVHVWTLANGRYKKQEPHKRGGKARSTLLRGFEVDVAKLFDAAVR